MKTFPIADDLEIEAVIDEMPHVVIRQLDDDPYAETQSITIFAGEIRVVILALTECAVIMADQVSR